MRKIIIYCLIFLFSFIPLFAKVLVVKVDDAITPSTASFIKRSIVTAKEENAKLLIIELNTPGGLLESTRDIVSEILSSNIPIVVYVSPTGARAGSAGVFITLSAHFAVMAPGTNIGAAHPVGIGGQSDSSAMFDKITNDASAFIRTIAQRRNRNQDWAERAVRESISSTENEALAQGVIDFIAPSIKAIIDSLDGREIEINDFKKKLNLKNQPIEYLEKSWRDELLSIITNPNIAYILLMIGIYGIFFELYNPGSIFPGVIGGICLILAAYSLKMLPINYAGLALILLAIILFIVEIKVASYGLLTVGGVISLLLGSIMLIDSPFEFMQISLNLIITFVVFTTIFFVFIIGLGIKAQYRKKALGGESLIGQKAVVIEAIKPGKKGMVKIQGEIWKAVSDVELNENQEVIVESIDSLTLFVKPLKE